MTARKEIPPPTSTPLCALSLSVICFIFGITIFALPLPTSCVVVVAAALKKQFFAWEKHKRFTRSGGIVHGALGST
jgi:hypothetical protein